ncbi:Ankyrin repeat protein [Giardia duodenalis assemblage B]|uniref:Ankyrin repeat protein n=1 Tax=Giardia duodenalis assemblage B TaxID=1394984 RepID=A0A132NWT1_GIAIN|nr:Ankyrin repeat protein [Giardia intestinalis assemblage B]
MPPHSSAASKADDVVAAFGDQLGSGALGVVYRLKNAPQDAIKEIRTDGVTNETLECFKKLTPVLIRLDNPNVLKYKDVFAKEDFMYMRMQLCEESLETSIKTLRRKKALLDDDEVLDIVQQIAGGLVYLHDPNKRDANGNPLPVLCCYDLQPSNVLVLDDKKRFVISDFGIPRDGLNNTVRPSIYAAPEVHTSKKYSPASDVWSLGVILYELHVGSRPPFFKDSSPKSVYVRGWTPDLSAIKCEPIKGILSRVLVLNEDERPSAAELSGMIEDAKSLVTVSIQRYRELGEKCKHAEAEVQRLKDALAAKDAEIRQLRASLGASPPTSTGPSPASTELIAAVQRGDAQAVRSLASSGKGLRMTDVAGMTALMHAAKQGSSAIASMLLDEVRMKDNARKVALMYAAENGCVETVRVLANREAASRDSDGRCALMLAAERGHVPVVLELLPYEQTLKDSRGWTALMHAAKSGQTEAVRVLVEKQKGRMNNDNQTALDIVQSDTSIPNRSAVIDILSKYSQEKH